MPAHAVDDAYTIDVGSLGASVTVPVRLDQRTGITVPSLLHY